MERLTISGGKICFYNDVINKCSNQDAPHIKKKFDEGKKSYEIDGYEYKSYSTDELKAIYARLAELEDKLESGQMVDTTPYIVEIKNEIPFKYKVIKPTMHKRNVEMCSSMESAEARLKKLQEGL